MFSRKMAMNLSRQFLLTAFFLSAILIISPLVQNSRIQASSPDYWPTVDWQTATPEAHNMNATLLTEMEAYIDLWEWADEMTALLVVHEGYLVYENYFGNASREDELQPIQSITGSITSILIGIAIAEGFIGSVHDCVIDYFPTHTFDNMNAWKEAMTIEHLLMMKSGLPWGDYRYAFDSPTSDYYNMTHTDDWVQWLLDRPLEYPPGEYWLHNTGATHLLSAIITVATGMNTSVFADEYLFSPLGITDFEWLNDPEGAAMGGYDLYLRPRDMAKISFLYLHGGVWEGQSIVPYSWVTASLTTYHTIVPAALSHGYGYQWWTHPRIGAFAAHAFYGSRIFVIPGYNLIMILTGNNHDINQHSILENYIMPSLPAPPPLINPLVPIVVIAVSIIIAVAVVGMLSKRRRQ